MREKTREVVSNEVRRSNLRLEGHLPTLVKGRIPGFSFGPYLTYLSGMWDWAGVRDCEDERVGRNAVAVSRGTLSVSMTVDVSSLRSPILFRSYSFPTGPTRTHYYHCFPISFPPLGPTPGQHPWTVQTSAPVVTSTLRYPVWSDPPLRARR